MMADTLWQKSATELAAMIREKQVTSRAVVESHLARIEAVNDKVNAVTVTLAETALEAADKADGTEPAGPFHGVPFTIKENIDCAGSATTQGVPSLADAISAVDAPVVARMKAAGAIPLARTNLPEMALRISTVNPLRGRTYNPWDKTRVAGGSSGGEAAALATGMSPIGLGNDLGGSLRNPAYCCGIASLKPSTGRIPSVNSMPSLVQPLAYRLMGVEGPLARSVQDLKAAIGVLAGWHPQDPFSVSAALEGPAVAKRAAIVTELPDTQMPESTLAAIREAGHILEDQGWSVEELLPPELEKVIETWGHVLTLDVRSMLPEISPIMSQPAVRFMEDLLRKYDTSHLSASEIYIERDRLAIAWSVFLDQYPVLIGPTWADIPFLHDEDIDPENGLDTALGRVPFILPANVLGLPSLALPMGVADGLPTGIQIYGQRWREDVCLSTAETIEAQVGRITPIDPR